VSGLLLTGAPLWPSTEPVDIAARKGVVAADAGPEAVRLDLAGLTLLPGLVNADDHLQLSTLPPLGSAPPYPNAYAWTAELAEGPVLADALSIPEPDRLWLGAWRNVLAGVTGVFHHGPFHRSMARDDFPVRVQARYAFAVSPGGTPALRRSYRTTDRRIPWIVHCAEGTDAVARGEVELLAAANVLRQNSVLVHAIGVGEEEAGRVAAANACVVWCPEADARLYGATADVRLLRSRGVRVGLGTDAAAAGARDALSNLAAARATGWLEDAELLQMATRGSAEVARLPTGALEPGAPCDFTAVTSLDELLSGNRAAVAAVLVRGELVYGRPALFGAGGTRCGRLTVDGEERAVRADDARRLKSLFPASRRAGARWVDGISLIG
jgi:cytosine/adenosine deaminase-related metal-dependent hydrolase